MNLAENNSESPKPTDEEIKYVDHINSVVSSAIAYNDYIIYNCIKVEAYYNHKISELQNSIKCNNGQAITSFDVEDLDILCSFQELIATKLDKLMGSFDKEDFKNFAETWRDEEIILKKYKRDFKIKSLTSGEPQI